jgi:hypothetical protein
MSIVVNKNTTQSPMSTVGTTGAQVLKFIDAPRMYVKAADPTTATPVQNYFTKSNGVTPTGWTDLGVIEGKVKIGVQKKTKEIKTGIDSYFRFAYTDEKFGTFEFSLDQFDDVIIGQITGVTPSVITAGSIVSYPVGSEDLKQLAVLMVLQNKLDGKEIQFYNPAAFFNFSFEDAGEQLVLKCLGMLPFFTPSGATSEGMLQTTVFA